MPFGLVHAPTSFQSLMAGISRNMTQDYVLSYINDILIYSRKMHDHLIYLQNTFDKLKQANLRLNPSKCYFALDKIKCIEHITPSGISTDPTKIRAVSDFPTQTNKIQMRSSLGICCYYRQSVKGYAAIAAPSNNKLKKSETTLE